MDGINQIAGLKIDISIKNRKKMKFNQKHQFKNPFENNRDYVFAKNCQKNHTLANQKNKKACMEINLDDIASFREQLYKSTEKRDQNDFLVQFIKAYTCKDKSKQKTGRRLLSADYFLPKQNGLLVGVCREMFETVTGFGGSKCEFSKRSIFNGEFSNAFLFFRCKTVQEKF